MAREHPASGSLNAGRMMYVGRVPHDQPITPGRSIGELVLVREDRSVTPPRWNRGRSLPSTQRPIYAKGRTSRCGRGTGAAGFPWGVAREGKAAGYRVSIARLGDYPIGAVIS